MNPADLERIERTLGITLPDDYRAVMSEYPLRASAGNADTELWDDADALIARNAELRRGAAGGGERWPAHFFFIGDPLTACAYAIDLREPQAPVWWVDHCDLGARASGPVAPSFRVWAEQLLASRREELERDGIDGDAPPPAGRGPGCLGALLFGSALLELVSRRG